MTKDECGLVDKCPDNPLCEACESYIECWPDTWAAQESSSVPTLDNEPNQ